MCAGEELDRALIFIHYYGQHLTDHRIFSGEF
jgi:hypothetical protein